MADLSKLADDLSRLTVLEAAQTFPAFGREVPQSPQARQSNVSFAAIKNDLPAWPDEVIKEWLLYLGEPGRYRVAAARPAWPSLMGLHTRT